MKVFQTVAELQSYLLEIKNLANSSVGFVPTMGALHAGHISLIEKSNAQTDITVCSIFVNPTQFNDKKDFERYPIQVDRDIEMLIQANCDVVFIPGVEEIYPAGAENKVLLDLGFVGQTLEAQAESQSDRGFDAPH
ncbi:MAG TPA: pantoate--beta-alanine ligase, partial [Chitinophagales bacterium]|nr:pantoate--beta-alanine ligase [Chitinophagales bacterium]